MGVILAKVPETPVPQVGTCREQSFKNFSKNRKKIGRNFKSILTRIIKEVFKSLIVNMISAVAQEQHYTWYAWYIETCRRHLQGSGDSPKNGRKIHRNFSLSCKILLKIEKKVDRNFFLLGVLGRWTWVRHWHDIISTWCQDWHLLESSPCKNWTLIRRFFPIY